MSINPDSNNAVKKYPKCTLPKAVYGQGPVNNKYSTTAIANELQHSSVTNSLVKIARSLVTISNQILQKIGGNIKSADKVAGSLGLSVNILKALGFFSSISSVVHAIKEIRDIKAKKSEKNPSTPALKIVSSGVFGVPIAVAAGFSIAEFAGLVKISKLLGKIPFFGSRVLPYFPFASITAGLEIGKASFEIAGSAVVLDDLRKEQKSLLKHRASWKKLDFSSADAIQNTFTEFVELKVAHKNHELYGKKSNKLLEQQGNLQNRVKKIEDKLGDLKKIQKAAPEAFLDQIKNKTKLTAAENFQKHHLLYKEAKLRHARMSRLSKFFDSFSLNAKKTERSRASRKYHNIKRRLDVQTKNLNAITDKIQKRENDADLYSKLDNDLKSSKKLSRDDIKSIRKTRDLKIQKWNLKLLTNQDKRSKEIRSIVFNAILITVLAASIILAATGVGALAASLALGGGFLFITLFALANHLIGKPEERVWKPVELLSSS